VEAGRFSLETLVAAGPGLMKALVVLECSCRQLPRSHRLDSVSDRPFRTLLQFAATLVVRLRILRCSVGASLGLMFIRMAYKELLVLP